MNNKFLLVSEAVDQTSNDYSKYRYSKKGEKIGSGVSKILKIFKPKKSKTFKLLKVAGDLSGQLYATKKSKKQ
jgi:hypothetical protein